MAESYSVEAVLSARDNMSSVLNRAGQNAESLGSKLKNSALFGLGFKAVSGAINMVSNSIGSAVSRFDQLNNFPRVMENMKIPTEQSEKAMDRLSKSMAKLPTSLDTATAGVQRFTSANGDIEKSTDYFLALNDAVIAGGGNIQTQQSAIEQLSQAYSKGKMDMMEWRTLQQAMPAQLNQVAQAMGMSADALGEGLRSGSVSMDEFMGKLVELDKEGTNGFKSFKEQAEASCDGINTAIANVKTAITRGLANAFTSVDEALKKGGLSTIGQTINNLIPLIDGFSSKVSKSIGGLIDFLTGKMSATDFGSALAKGFDSALSIVSELVQKLASKFVKALPKIAGAIIKALPSVIKSIFKTITSLALDAVKNVVKAMTSVGKEIVKGLWNGAKSMVSWVVDKFKGLGKSILSGIKSALGIHSPSRVFRDQVGKNIMLGIVEGIEKTNAVVNTAVNMVMPDKKSAEVGTSYSFGNITLDVSKLEDIVTVEQFVNMMKRAKAFA